MSLGIAANQDSSYGAAFRNKPLMFPSRKEIEAALNGKHIRSTVLHENNNVLGSNDLYRNRNTTYEIGSGSCKGDSIDMSFLIRDETSCLKGNLSDSSDVDFYNFQLPFSRALQNQFGVDIYLDMPEGCDYNMTLFDEYGNQVGKAEWSADGRKVLSVPNWDTKTSNYAIRIENADGTEVSPENYYKISCHVTDNQETELTDALRKAAGEIREGLHLKDESYLENYNNLMKEAEQNYLRELDALHQKQFDALPDDKKYSGDKTVDELLDDMASGKELTEVETEYLKIFANLKDYEKAKQSADLKNSFSAEFTDGLKSAGISPEDAAGMQISISSDGSVSVSGVDDEIAEKVKGLIEDKYSDKLYQYYVGTSDSINDLPSDSYKFITQVQEVKRYLNGMTGEDVDLSRLHLANDGKIGGLPDKAAKIINNTSNNVKIDEIRDSLRYVIQNISRAGNGTVPEFSCDFGFDGEELFTLDSGFSTDMAAVTEAISYKHTSSKYSDRLYNYGLKKVL